MEGFTKVATISDFPKGSMKMFKIGENEVLVALVAGKYYACDNHCTHMGGNLSLGTLAGTVITCPLHHSQYDIRDGHVIRWTDWTRIKLNMAKIIRSPRPLNVYDVVLDGTNIMISNQNVPVIAAV